jgi:hypothetical protein
MDVSLLRVLPRKSLCIVCDGCVFAILSYILSGESGSLWAHGPNIYYNKFHYDLFSKYFNYWFNLWIIKVYYIYFKVYLVRLGVKV